MNKLVGTLFAITCFSTSALSSSLMGTGLWFWVIIASGFLVAGSQFFPKLESIGSAIAMTLGILSVFAVLLGLLASTIGGSFKIDSSTALLLFLFFLISILGFVIVRLNKKPAPSYGEIDTKSNDD